jgi:hypothetical protein
MNSLSNVRDLHVVHNCPLDDKNTFHDMKVELLQNLLDLNKINPFRFPRTNSVMTNAIAAGNISLVTYLCESTQIINTKSLRSFTVFTDRCSIAFTLKQYPIEVCLHEDVANKIDVLTVLLNNGADPNLSSIKGWTPLSLAVEESSSDIVALLALRGAKLFSNDIKNLKKFAHKLFEAHKDSVMAVSCKANLHPELMKIIQSLYIATIAPGLLREVD